MAGYVSIKIGLIVLNFYVRIEISQYCISFSGFHKGGIFVKTNLVFSKMEKKVFQIERTQVILCQRYKGKFLNAKFL